MLAGVLMLVCCCLCFQSNDWIRVRIQQMEPDLMEVGSSLEEARALRAEHDQLLMKLNVSTIQYVILGLQLVHIEICHFYLETVLLKWSQRFRLSKHCDRFNKIASQ